MMSQWLLCPVCCHSHSIYDYAYALLCCIYSLLVYIYSYMYFYIYRKGTQCDLIAQKYCYEHLSAGELLRAERRKDTETSRLINSCISEGRLVPSEVTTGLLASAINGSPCKNFLVDGFPRSKFLYCIESSVSI
jgi:hypothetical protein